MFTLATIPLPHPVTVRVPVHVPLRSRVQAVSETDPQTTDSTLEVLHVCFRINTDTRSIHAEIPPLPEQVRIYGPDDFPFVVADTPEQHAERVLQLLGSDPATVLQAWADGRATDPPKRVPRELPNWRVKAVLHQMGHLERVEQTIATLPDPEGTIIRLAWAGDAKFARHSATVEALSASLGLTPTQLDDIFIRAEGIPI